MNSSWRTVGLLLFVLAIVIVTIPVVGTAMHFSVGATDSIGISLDETSEAKSVSDAEWNVGAAETCDPLDSPDGQDDAGQVLTGDAFCGELQYHESPPDGLPSHWYEDDTFLGFFSDQNWDQQAPQDQDFPRDFFEGDEAGHFESLKFDVQPASYVGTYNLQTIDGGFFPALRVYERAEVTPLQSDDRETVCDQHRQANPADDAECSSAHTEYGGSLLTPNAAQLAQERIEEETEVDWRMNGWLLPDLDQSFIAFLEDDQGPVTDDRLETIIGEMKAEGVLHGDAVPGICGYADGFGEEIKRTDSSLDDPCPVTFRFAGESPDSATDPGPDRYDHPCEGVLYACNQAQDPAWYAEWVCPAVPVGEHLKPVETTLYYHDAAGEECREALDSTDKYQAWHFVVAPTPSKCDGDQQPGFFTTHELDRQRFVAYDLDVFTPPQSAFVDGAGVTGWVGSVQETAQSDANEALTALKKGERVEPNYDGSADPLTSGLEDTSQQDILLERELPACNLLDEDANRVPDPWVNVLDAELERRTLENTDEQNLDKRPDGISLPLIGASPQDPWLAIEDDLDALGAYGTDDASHDRSNRPGPAYMMAKGHASIYHDEDDDGTFGPWTSSDERQDVESVHEVGAYPMGWDDSCKLETNGYGPGTGLVQAIYLPYETHFVTRADDSAGAYTAVLTEDSSGEPLENNVYLFFSGDAREAYENESHDAHDQIQSIVDEMTAPFKETFDAGEVNVRKAWNETYSQAFVHETPAEDDADWLTVSTETAEEYVVPPRSDFQGDGAACPMDQFENRWSFLHNCHAEAATGGCEGATMVTAYVYNATRADGSLGSEIPSESPVFRPGLGDAVDYGEDEAFDFCSYPDRFGLEQPTEGCMRAWMDVDPIDNDPDRTLDDLSTWSPLRHDPAFS